MTLRDGRPCATKPKPRDSVSSELQSLGKFLLLACFPAASSVKWGSHKVSVSPGFEVVDISKAKKLTKI